MNTGNDKMREHIRKKEQAYLERQAGIIREANPPKKYWWETEEQEGD